MGKDKEKNEQQSVYFSKDSQNFLRMRLKELGDGISRRYHRLPSKAWSALGLVIGISLIILAVLFTGPEKPTSPLTGTGEANVDQGIYVDENLKIQARIPDEQLALEAKAEINSELEKAKSKTTASKATTGKAINTDAEETTLTDLSVKYPLSRHGAIITGYGIYHNAVLDVWRHHSGVDIRCKIGDKVKAIAAGTVTAIKESDQEELLITLDHGNGWKSVYGQVGEVRVKTGDKVSQGQVIGAVVKGATALEPHLHLELRLNDQPLNPQKYLK